MTYILAIILLFFALPFIGRLIVRGLQWWFARKVARMQREAFEQAFGHRGSERETSPGNGFARNAPQRDETPHRRGKRIDPSVGEYVEYEEIASPADCSATSSDPAAERFVAESQIVDAEWEDVK